MSYDPKGLKARCIRCGRAFYIPWITMCDAGICDKCLKAGRLTPQTEGSTNR